MKPIQIKKPFSNYLHCFFLFISVFFVLSVSAQNYTVTDKITIVKMFNGQQPSGTAVLTINEPCGYPKTPDCGKPIKKIYNLNSKRQYNSGTTFRTHDNYTILLRANGSTSQVQPNSSNRIKLNNGNEVHDPKGVVGIIADQARDLNKSIIINGHNVSAKMKTTEFWVQTNGGQTKFTPVEGTISIIEKVAVTVGNSKFTNTTENRERSRNATFPVRTERSGGDAAYSTGVQANKNYNSVNDAITTINAYINQYRNAMYPEELAEAYILLGEFYLNIQHYENAMICFNYSAELYTDIDPTGLNAMEAELYLAEAEIYSNQPNAKAGINSLIDELIDDLNYYYEEYVSAGESGENNIQAGYCYNLVDTMDLLGWAYDLIDNEPEADKYYAAAEKYPCQY